MLRNDEKNKIVLGVEKKKKKKLEALYKSEKGKQKGNEKEWKGKWEKDKILFFLICGAL